MMDMRGVALKTSALEAGTENGAETWKKEGERSHGAFRVQAGWEHQGHPSFCEGREALGSRSVGLSEGSDILPGCGGL